MLRHKRREVEEASRRLRHGDLEQPFERVIDRAEIRLHHRLTLAAVAFADRLLDMRDRLLARQHARDGEETGLQHRVGAATQPDVLRYAGGIDDEQPQSEPNDFHLHRARKMIPDFVWTVGW